MMKIKRLVFAVLALGIISFLGIVIETALNVTFPVLMQQFNISSGVVQWLTSGYMFISTIIIPFGAFFRKRFKVIVLFRMGTCSFFVGTIMVILSSNFFILLLGRLVQGVANGLVLPLMFSVIISQAPRKQLGTFMGLGSLVLAFAPAVGPIYGGFISQHFNWKFVFVFLIPTMIIAYLLGEKYIEQDIQIEKVKFDIKGGLLLAVILLGGLLLINSITSSSFSNLLQLTLGVLVGVSITIFIRYENRQSEALLNLKVFKRKGFVQFLLSFFMLQLMSLSMSYLIPNVLQLGFNMDTAVSGLLVTPAAIMNGLVSILGGIIYDKLKQRIPIVGGVMWVLVTFTIMMLIEPSSRFLAFMYVSFMFGLGISYSNIMTFSLSKLPRAMVNDGNSIYMTAQSYAGSLGIALSASIMGLTQSDHVSLIKGTLVGYKLNIIIFVSISIITLGLLIQSMKRLKN